MKQENKKPQLTICGKKMCRVQHLNTSIISKNILQAGAKAALPRGGAGRG